MKARALRVRRVARGIASLLVTSLLGSAATARGQNALNSNEKPPSSAGTSPGADEGKNELTILPAAGGSTDIGVAIGYFAALTRTQRGYVPYVWNLESAGLVSFGLRSGSVYVPYVDVYGNLTVPRLFGDPIDLELRPSFTDERTLYYYGMGNASSANPPAGQPTTYLQYARIHPSLLADLRFKLLDHLAGKIGMRYTGSWLDIPARSSLAQDQRTGSAEVKELIGPTAPSQVALFMYGLQLDTRDSEVNPHAGTFDEAKIKWSPGGDGTFPFRYGEASLNLRGYVPLSRRVTLAGRIVGDVLFGSPPLSELPRFEDTYFGGDIRGVPAQRYYGKVKVIANLEGRVRVVDFHALSKPMSFGFAIFFDGGRVWADTSAHPELDGTGLGLKYGIGGGVRLTSGAAFVLRADLAWSPDAMPVGAYVTAGEMF
jgi:outer membrane protein assembly factor BamA